MFGGLFFRADAGCLMSIAHLWNQNIQHLGYTFKSWNVKERVVGQFTLKYLNNKYLYASYRNYALHQRLILKLLYVMAHYYILNSAAAHILYEIENLLFTNLTKTYFSQDLQHKVLSKHKSFAAHFSLFSGTPPVCRVTQFGKHCSTQNYYRE